MKYIFLVFVLFATHVYGVDIQHPNGMRIRATSVEANLSTGVTTYFGNVVVTKSSIKLSANKVMEYKNKNVLTKIVAEGTPVEYNDREALLSDIVYGIARRFEYHVSTGKVTATDFEFRDVNGNTSKASSGSYAF